MKKLIIALMIIIVCVVVLAGPGPKPIGDIIVVRPDVTAKVVDANTLEVTTVTKQVRKKNELVSKRNEYADEIASRQDRMEHIASEITVYQERIAEIDSLLTLFDPNSIR